MGKNYLASARFGSFGVPLPFHRDTLTIPANPRNDRLYPATNNTKRFTVFILRRADK